MGKSSRAWVGALPMGDDPVNNPADDEAYEPGEAARGRRGDADRGRRSNPNRPGAPSAPPPPAESFRPAGPPPPADWFKPTSGRGGQQGRDGDETSRPARGANGPGSAGYTSQPGIPVERYPTPRPGEFPSPVAPPRRSKPSSSGGTSRPQGRSGQERATEYIGRVGSGAEAGGRGSQGAPTSRPTEQMGYGQRHADPAADGYDAPYSEPYVTQPTEGGWGQQVPVDDGAWRAGMGGLPVGPAGTGGTPVPPPAAEPKRKKRRRRGRMIALIIVVLLLIIAIPVDRVAAHVAVGQMRKQVEVAVAENLKPGQQPPIVRKVSLGGFPFLTQVLFGKFKDVGVVLENIPTTTDGPKISSVDAHLKGVHVPLTDAISNNVGKVPVDDVRATVAINYDEINAFLKDKPFGWQLAPADGGKNVQITGSTKQTVLGQDVDVKLTGVGSFTVQNNQLTISPSNIKVDGSVGGFGGGGGIPIPGGASVPIPLPIPDNLPFDLKIVSAGTTATGLSVTATAKDVVLPEQKKK